MAVAPNKSEMTCSRCEFACDDGGPTIQCRNSPEFIRRQYNDWCGQGMWRVWSERFNAWTFYYWHEGLDDNNS